MEIADAQNLCGHLVDPVVGSLLLANFSWDHRGAQNEFEKMPASAIQCLQDCSDKSMRAIAIALFLLLSNATTAQDSSTAVEREIASLFVALDHSGCEFNRNGKWYDAHRAAKHLRRKYDYLVKRGLLTTTESFIELAASKSSISGKPYLVRCDGKRIVESKSWFTGTLIRLRASNPVGAHP